MLQFIRRFYEAHHKCPTIFETCRECRLGRQVLKRLFPTGCKRGACKLAGMSYKEACMGANYMEHSAKDMHAATQRQEYRVHVRGVLVDPDEWDEHYAAHRAYDKKIRSGKLTVQHWKIIRYLRSAYYKTGRIPTIVETCEANSLEIDEPEALFPDGYHRGAIKIAGLRLR